MIMMEVIIDIMRDVFIVIMGSIFVCHYEERSDVIILIL